jgi:uroporphyrin-III C-methyltransferase
VLVGGGPGTTRLLTLEACEALLDADVVFYDRLAPTADLARLAPGAELVDVGKLPYHHPTSQDRIQELIIERARRGQTVVRLKGGDPFVFGRGGEEILACRAAGVDVRVVPGVTSAVAVPAAAGIPVTHRGASRAFTVLSGHLPPSSAELAALAGLGGTVVILMGMANLTVTVTGLVAAGMSPDTPAAVVERGFSDSQRTTPGRLADLPALVGRVGVTSPAVVVIGDVAAFAADQVGAGPLSARFSLLPDPGR